MSEMLARFQLLGFHLVDDTPLPAIALTLAAYLLGQRLYHRFKLPMWCPPILLSAILLAGFLALLPIDFESYSQGAEWLAVLLGPATVALGVPLYQQIHHIRALWRPILITLPIAATLAAVYAVALAWWLGAGSEVMLSIAPKSVTAPIALGITDQIGGSISLMMGALLITGVVTTFFVGLMTPRFGITDERVIGFVLGLNGHAIGTVRAFEISSTAGAFASLGMGLTGLFTAIWLPVAISLL